MTLVSNQTGFVVATGDWQQVAAAGECVVECSDAFEDALVADLVNTPVIGHRHAGSHPERVSSYSAWTIPDGASLWVRAEAGETFVITAKAPLA